jgi:hypothetical protein
MPEDASVAAFCVLFDELATVVFQAAVILPVSYPVWSLDEILYVSGVGPESGLEGLRLVGLDVIGPEFDGQLFYYPFLHKNLSGGIAWCHPVNL